MRPRVRGLSATASPPHRHWRGVAVSHVRRPRPVCLRDRRGSLLSRSLRLGTGLSVLNARPVQRRVLATILQPAMARDPPALSGQRCRLLVPTPRMPCESPPTPPAGRPGAPARGSLGGNRPRAPGRGRGARPATPPGHPAWYRGGQPPVTQNWVLSAHPRRGSSCAPRPPAAGFTQLFGHSPRCRGSHWTTGHLERPMYCCSSLLAGSSSRVTSTAGVPGAAGLLPARSHPGYRGPAPHSRPRPARCLVAADAPERSPPTGEADRGPFMD